MKNFLEAFVFLLITVKAHYLYQNQDSYRWKIIPTHQAYIVQYASSVEVKLPIVTKNVAMDAKIETIPDFGTLYQVTQVYDVHGYEPKFERDVDEDKILRKHTKVYGKDNNLIYALPNEYEYELTPENFVKGTFKYYARFKYELYYEEKSIQINTLSVEKTGVDIRYLKEQTAYGFVTLLNEDKIFLRSMFTFSNEGWQVVNNNLCVGDKLYEDYYVSDRRGEDFIENFDLYDTKKDNILTEEENGIVSSLIFPKQGVIDRCTVTKASRIGHENSQLLGLSRFVFGSEKERSLGGVESEPEFSRWYFKAPTSYHEDWTIMYGGTIEFTIGFYGGDFREYLLFNSDLNILYLECRYCNKASKARLAYNINPNSNHTIMQKIIGEEFGSFTVSVTLSADDDNWQFVPASNRDINRQPTACEFVEFLSDISGFYILGDYLKEYETVGLDDVILTVDKVGPESGPPRECYCAIPGLACVENEVIPLTFY